ncbi:MAG: glycosyltransferase family 39 protein [Chthoniobacterales bacterium]
METFTPAPELRRPESKDRVLWLVLIALAALLRLGPIASGLPYIDYVDEGYVLHQATDLLNKRTFDTGWYGYPSLPAYLTAGALIAEGGIYRYLHGHSFRSDLPQEEGGQINRRDNYDIISPPELIIAGRLVAACLSLGTVLLAGGIATRLGGRAAGLLAILITAVCPALVARASNVIVDTFATFFALLALYCCERLWSKSNNSWEGAIALAAGMAAGLAFASKYTAGAVFVPIILLLCALSASKAGRVRLSLWASLGLFLGIALGAPAVIFKLRTVVQNVAGIAANYRIITSSPGYLGQSVSASELGWPLAIAGCAGFWLMLRRKSTRSTAIGWGVFALVLLALFVGRPFQPFRNLLPLVPPFCIAAAIAFSALIGWARQGARPRRRLVLTVALISAGAVSLALPSFRQVQGRLAQRDSRVQAIDWLHQNAAREETVLGIRELAILPAEWKRIAARPTVVSLFEASDLLERQPFDYIVTGDFDLRYATDPASSSAHLARWKENLSRMPVQAVFGQVVTPVVPYLWRTNDERIIIVRRNAP